MGDAAAPPVGRTSKLVGRDLERSGIDAFLVAATDGVRSFAVRGEPGIGKTALWRHALERAQTAGFRVLRARPAEEEMSIALGGVVDLFEGTKLDAEALCGRDDPFDCGRRVLEELRSVAGEGPTVVAVDDVQWLDVASARALRYAFRRLDTQPVALLTTSRAGVPDPLAAESTLPPGRHEELVLGPLGVGSLRRVLGGTVAAISRPALRRIHAVSGGNPLYAIELARGLDTDGRAHATTADLPLPTSLRAAIAQRLDGAPPELLPLLELVSSFGPTPVTELRDLLPGGDLDALLARAEEEGLLALDEGRRVRFAHPLVGAGVYGRIGPLARRELHARLAARAADADVRARHLALSTDEPDAGVAQLLEDAAVRASRRGASEAAADLASHSLRLTPPDDEDAALRRALAEIEQLAAAGEVSRALALADQLVDTLPPGPRRVEALVRRADLEDDDRATAEALLLDALDDAGADAPLRGRVLGHLAQLRRLGLGDVPGAIECAREALMLAERAGDARLEVHAAAYLGHLETLAGTPRPELMAHAVRLEETIGSPPLSVTPRTLLAKHRLWAGDLAGARSLLAAAHATAVRAGNEIQRSQRFYDRALIECAAGELEVAEELVRSGIEAARDAENTYGERELLYPLALVEAWLGRSDDARATVARLHAEAERHGVRPLLVRAGSVLGLLTLSEGDSATAARELTSAADLLESMGFANPAAFPVLADAVEAVAHAGEPGAMELLDRLELQAAAVGGEWAEAAAQRARGVVLLADGRADDAAEELDGALATFDHLGFRPDAARTLLALGRALLRGGHRTHAADALAGARGRFAAIGAELWAARAGEELERAAPGRTSGMLTPAERRVAALVADGRRNREIAQALFMSVATVEAHLTRIYRKLEIGSRSELTRLVADGAVPVSPEP